jgi:hypothetical protein
MLSQEEQIGEVRTVKSLGHEDYAKELYKQRADATFKTRVRLAVVLAPLEGIVDTLFDGILSRQALFSESKRQQYQGQLRNAFVQHHSASV